MKPKPLFTMKRDTRPHYKQTAINSIFSDNSPNRINLYESRQVSGKAEGL